MVPSANDEVLYEKLPAIESESDLSPRYDQNSLDVNLLSHCESTRYNQPYRWPTAKLILVFTTIQIVLVVVYSCVILNIVERRAVTTCRPRLEDKVICEFSLS